MPASGGAPLTGPAKPPASTSKPAPPIQVKAHTRAAPTARPSKAAAPATRPPANPLLDPSQTLSGQSLLKAAQGLAATQINPAITDLQKQIAANNAQNAGTIKLTGGFYNQLEPYVQGAASQSGQIAAGLNSTLSGIASDTRSQLAGLGQNALSSLLKYAPQGDGGLANAATSDLAAQIARQQGLAAQQAGNYRAFGATQGADNQQFTNSLQGTYGLQGQEALKNIAQSGTVKNEPLVSKIAGLLAQRGALTATDLGKLRQQEVANQISRAGLGLKQQTLQNTAANDQARNRIAAQNANTSAFKASSQAAYQSGQLRYDQAKVLQAQVNEADKVHNQQLVNAYHNAQLAQKAAQAGQPKVLPGGDQARLYGEINKAEGLIQEWQGAAKQYQAWVKAGKPGSMNGVSDATVKSFQKYGAPPLNNAQMRSTLAAKGTNPVFVDAAFEILGWRALTPRTAQTLHTWGLRAPAGSPYAKVAPPPQRAPNPLLPAAGARNSLAPASTGL